MKTEISRTNDRMNSGEQPFVVCERERWPVDQNTLNKYELESGAEVTRRRLSCMLTTMVNDFIINQFG